MCILFSVFSVLLALFAGNSPVTGEFPSQRPETRSFDVFFDLHLNKWSVSNRDTGDKRRHRTHYGVTVMTWTIDDPVLPRNLIGFVWYIPQI